MLLQTDALHSLRIGSARSVYNGVFVEEAPLLDDGSLELLRSHLRTLWPTTFPGNVDVKGVSHQGAITDCIDQFRSSLEEYLRSYGFLQEEFNDSDLWCLLDFMVSRGARPHADVYNSDWHYSLFYVYVLEAGDADLYFPNLGLNIPLTPGQLIIFDPGQPHAVVGSGAKSFRESDFPARNRQGYIAGSLRYDEEFWEQLGVTQDAMELRFPGYKDIVELDVDWSTGALILDTA